MVFNIIALGAITGAPEGPKQLLAALGWDLPPGVNDIGLASVDLRSVVDSLDRLHQQVQAVLGREQDREAHCAAVRWKTAV